MDLTTEFLGELIAAMRSVPSERQHELRRWRRVNVRAKAALWVEGEGDGPVDITVRDLSIGGMGFTSGRVLEPGMRVKLVLKRQGGCSEVPGQVTHCRVLMENVYAAGISFED